jgi:predicted nucleic acid-binding protein
MEWVFDASVTMAWCFDDERTPQTEALFDRLIQGSVAIVPQIWPLEILNVLLLAGRRGRITLDKRTEFLDLLATAPIQIDDDTARRASSDTLPLAEAHRLTTYDAAYLELALRHKLPLATLDKELRAAAIAANIVLL